jgi:intracellular sulfur oxidation DsrE/DsrF family protein
MHRRNMLRGALAGVGAFFTAARAQAAAGTAEKLKAVYHLSDLDEVTFVLGNIPNHLDGVGAPDHVTIALVVHGPAPKAFHAFEATPEIGGKVSQFSRSGLQLAACATP